MEAHTSTLVLLIPIVAIVLGIGVAFWAIYWDHRAKQMKFRERELMIEKGLTPSSFEPQKGPATLEDYLRRGIVMIFLGIGLGIGYVVLLHSWGPPAWLCGVGAAVVGLLGIGNLVFYAIARKQKNETSENNSRISIP
jgi:hypothetical protein